MVDALVALFFVGAMVGVLAGLLGVGGGLVLVSALVFLLPMMEVPSDSVAHVAIGTALLTTVVTALRTTQKHHARKSVLWTSVLWLAPGLALGAWGGSFFATQLDGTWLTFAVAAYCFVAAVQLVVGQPRPRTDTAKQPAGWGWAALGTGIGGISSFVGIGGGSMTVPSLIRAGVAPVRAVGTSSACGLVIALAGAAGYAAFGSPVSLEGTRGAVFIPGALAAAAGSILTAPLGVKLAHTLSADWLRYVFALFLLLMGAMLIYQAS